MSAPNPNSLKSHALTLLSSSIQVAVALYGTYWAYCRIQEQHNAGAKPTQLERAQQDRLLKHLSEHGRLNRIEQMQFNSYERQIMQDVVFPSDVKATTWESIGGMTKVKDEIQDSVLLPLLHPELYRDINGGDDAQNAQLLKPPSGCLFYGPPGTGKTLMARAIASSSNATFINLKASTIHNKWFGESQKLVSAVFSLAHKLAPCIIFADEADSLLVKRGGGGGEGGPSAHEVSTSMMAQFLTLIDGLCDADSSEVLFLCATNRPFDMDEAILRRLSKQILFGLPDETERLAILKVTLASTKLEPNVSLALLARRLDQYSGSDIKELCKAAAMIPVAEALKSRKHALQQRQKQQKEQADKLKVTSQASTSPQQSPSASLQSSISNSSIVSNSSSLPIAADDVASSPVAASPQVTVRPVSAADFNTALEHVKPTGAASLAYQMEWAKKRVADQWRAAHESGRDMSP